MRPLPPSRIAAHARLLGLVLAIGFAGPGSRCEPGSVVVTARPDPPLVDEDGRADPDAFARIVAATEEQRGLEFIQRPTLELLAADDPRTPALAAAASALAPCPRTLAAPGSHSGGVLAAAEVPPAAGSCFPDPGLERVLCLAPPDRSEARRALGRLLDAQHYPRLVRAAPRLRGDPGVAIRSLLAASLRRDEMQGIGPAPGSAPYELLDEATIDVAPQSAPDGTCEAMALSFLAGQEDPEAAFRTPPLSTKQLVSPRSYRAGERPLLLVGGAPTTDGCSVVTDESVGVARLLVEHLANGGSLPGRALAGWRGDRGIRFACADGREPWVYVAVLTDDPSTAVFAEHARRLLPGGFAGDAVTSTLERRVVVSSGMPAERARRFAAGVSMKELERIDAGLASAPGVPDGTR